LSHAFWGPLNETIFTAHEDGCISIWDPETGKRMKTEKVHSKLISGFKFSKDKQFFVTASKDNTAKMYDTRSLQCLKTFTSGRPLNDIAISPILPHVLIVGGQEAVDVALIQSDSAQFRVRLFHTIYQQEIASVPGHFAPVNSIAYSPNGRSFASGGEDGIVRLHHLNDGYFKGLSDEVLFSIV